MLLVSFKCERKFIRHLWYDFMNVTSQQSSYITTGRTLCLCNNVNKYFFNGIVIFCKYACLNGVVIGKVQSQIRIGLL